MAIRAVFLLFIASLGVAQAGEPFERVASEMDAPVVMPWRSFRPDPAYHGQWLVAGDLDHDGRAEIVTARNDRQRVTTVLASRLDGSVLWRWGEPGAGEPGLGYDVPVQVHDLDGDGREEVWVSTAGFLLVLDGRNGKVLRRLPLPEDLEVADCITFADLRGSGRARDVIVKDRYRRIWAYTGEWKPLWDWRPARYRTCHHPTPVDIDRDGRDEILAGYTMLDHDGGEIWTVPAGGIDLARGHLDCCEVMAKGGRPEDFRLLVTYCGADAIALLDGTGKTLWAVTGHHFESVDAGRIRDDVSGKQVVVDIDHRPYGQGPVWLLDDKGKRLGTFICGYGRHHRLVDWNGDGLDDILIGNAQRLFSGKGECLLRFGPAGSFGGEEKEQDGNDPGPLAVVADLDGDERPEIILHSTAKVHIYRSEKAARVPGLKMGTEVNFTLY